MEENESAVSPELSGTDASVDTASTEQAEQSTQQPEGGEQKPAEKTFSQEELDKIVEKRLAKERRKFERQQPEPQRQPVQQGQRLDPSQFKTPEEYVEALANQRAEQRFAELERTSQHQRIIEAYQDREEEARDRYEDFEAVAYNPALTISDAMAISIQASDVGPDIAYHLGKNHKEAARIAKLHPLLQAKEIGKIEEKLIAEKNKPPQASSAPEPIKPIGPKGTAVKRVEDMTDDEFAEYRRKIRAQRR